MTRTIAALLALALVPATAAADVIPASYPERSAGGMREKIAKQFRSFGLQAERASARAAALTTPEARYFGSHPERIQVAGQEVIVVEEYRGLPGDVWFFGSLFLAAGIAGAAYTVYHFHGDAHIHYW